MQPCYLFVDACLQLFECFFGVVGVYVVEGDCLCEACDAVCVCLSVFVCPDVPDEEWPDDVAVLFHEVFEGDDASVVECAHHADCVECWGVALVVFYGVGVCV